ncbi:MAG: ABC transporter ATP-binding protein [Oscillospiraceae bacterium]|nr:ABC transporter ATP-binding protein [Oscillospiraceae bacterium]
MLKIENYSKSYTKDKKAVDGLSLEVKAGDLFAFIGHNGAGKTTTIKSAVGILPFEEGRIEVDGIDITADPVGCKKRLAYIPDNPDLYETLTGMQYLNFVGDIYRIPAADRGERVSRYAQELELADVLNDPINSYSHGMKQKLAIIGALLHEPKLIVMDEPFVGLDPKAAFTVKGIMRDFCARGGAIFFSTHVLEVAEKLCNKIAIIKGGRLVACGSMEEVKGQSSLEDVFMELIDHE